MECNPPSTSQLIDNPIQSVEEDVLEWKPIADEFASRILNLDASQGLVVGLIGSWGSGKTSFINLAKPKFKNKNVPVVEFNPWLFSGTDQLVYRFFSELSAELGEKSNLKELACNFKQYGDILSPMAQSVSSLLGIPLLGDFLNFCIEAAGKKESTSQLRKIVTEELRKRKEPIIVVLDDIDRLSGDEIRDLFKLVRLTASFPNLIYIVACDRIRVEEALNGSKNYGSDNYLEKIFQWYFDLPTVSPESIRRELHSRMGIVLGDLDPPFDDKRWPDIEAEIIRPQLRNMRDVNRYCISVHGIVQELANSIDIVDVFALEAIRLFMPSLFKQFPSLIEILTITTANEASANLAADELLEKQLFNSNTAATLHSQRLEEVLNALSLSAKDRQVADALVRRIFLGGRGEFNWHESDVGEQLRNNRLVHRFFFQFYLTRVRSEDLVTVAIAKRAFKCLHLRQALDTLIRSQNPESWSNIIFCLRVMFDEKFESNHVEPALTTFWNLLSDTPKWSPTRQDELEIIIRQITSLVLTKLAELENAAHTIEKIYFQLDTLTAKVGFIRQIKRLNESKDFSTDICLKKMEIQLINQIQETSANDLAIERHPAGVILYLKHITSSPNIHQVNQDSPKLTIALILDCRNESTSGEIGTRATDTRYDVNIHQLTGVFGSKETLEVSVKELDQNFSTIESWINSKLKMSPSDARHFLDLAKMQLQSVRDLPTSG